MTEPTLSRRELLKAAAGASLLGASAGTSRVFAQTPKRAAMIGIQMDLGELAKGDLDRLLGDLKERAGVNTLFPFIYGYVPEWAGLPADGYQGGNFGIPHMEFYKDTTLTYEQMRAPDYGDLDVLARTIAGTKKHGMQTFAWVLEHNRPNMPRGWEDFYEIDYQGRRQTRHPSGPCYNNPAYRNFVLGLVQDYAASYDIGGLMWASERQGGLWNALGAWHHGAGADPGQATCFCQYCVARAEKNHVDVDRAKAGFAAWAKFANDGMAGQRPTDGFFVTFMRLLFQYPELLMWERMWIDSRFDLMRDIRSRVTSVKPSLPVGWHVWHNVSFSPFHRAEMDYATMAEFSDYIKPVLYANSAGERMKSWVDGVGKNVFGDLGPEKSLEMLYPMLGYTTEAPYAGVTAAGFSAEYVRAETARCVKDVSGADHKVDVWPGIDVNVPVPRGASQTTPESIKAGVLAAFQAGATGVMLSRNYNEMTPENLNGAKAALKELGIV